MANRMILLSVEDAWIKASGETAGASGSANAVTLRMFFNENWDGTTKTVYFTDANGEVSVSVVIGLDDLADGEENTYDVPIPAEALSAEGLASITVAGVVLASDNETVERKITTQAAKFRVLDSDIPASSGNAGTITASDKEQLQSEIDALEAIFTTNKTAAETAASTASTKASEAAASAASAAGSATTASEKETAASGSASAAADSAATASTKADAASASATAADGSAGAAATSAQNAESSRADAQAAKTAAETAQGASETAASAASLNAGSASASAASAASSAEAAASSASSAATSASAAASSESNAADSATESADGATLSESWAVGGTGTRTGENSNNAKYWSDVAQGAASGGVSTFNGRSGAVVPVSGDYTAEMVGADPSGAAETAVSTHNVESGAHQNLNIAFTDAVRRANIYSGLSMSNILGRIKKYFTDLGSAAFSESSAFASATHTHTKSQITDFSHTHAQSEITGIVSDLAQKANLVGGKVPASELPSMGILPQLIITVDSGATVTATCGDVVLTGTSAGTCVLDLPSYGTWTVQATISGSTSASMPIVVDSVKKYTVSPVFASTTFGSNSWSTIRAVSAAGVASTLWSIGDKKSINLSTGQTVNAVIADFSHDVDADGNQIGLTLVLEDCLNTKYQMNSSNTNAGGWASCALRTTLNSTILGQLPADLQAVITSANKKTSAGSKSSTITETDDKLWLLSEIELFGSTPNSFAGEGTQYPIFSSDTDRVKKVSGSTSIWWGRSPCSGESVAFCVAFPSGIANTSSASYSYGVAFGFCV